MLCEWLLNVSTKTRFRCLRVGRPLTLFVHPVFVMLLLNYSVFWVVTSWPLNMGPVGSPETSVSNHPTPLNSPEDGRSQFNCDASLRCRSADLSQCCDWIETLTSLCFPRLWRGSWIWVSGINCDIFKAREFKSLKKCPSVRPSVWRSQASFLTAVDLLCLFFKISI